MQLKNLGELLAGHNGIGIDIDETLINGPSSLALQRWCAENHETHNLHLITFRYNGDFHYIGQDLADANVDINMFRGIHGIPAEASIPFHNMVMKVGRRDRAKTHAKWLRGLAHHKIKEEDYLEQEAKFAMWKGEKCKELGLTVLLDDLESFVKPGCDAHGIVFINSIGTYTF